MLSIIAQCFWSNNIFDEFYELYSVDDIITALCRIIALTNFNQSVDFFSENTFSLPHRWRRLYLRGWRHLVIAFHFQLLVWLPHTSCQCLKSKANENVITASLYILHGRSRYEKSQEASPIKVARRRRFLNKRRVERRRTQILKIDN